MSIKRQTFRITVRDLIRRRGAALLLLGVLLAVHVLRPLLESIADELEDARTAVMARYQDASVLEQSRTTDVS